MVTASDIQHAIQQLEDKWNNSSAKKGLFGNILKTVNIKNNGILDAFKRAKVQGHELTGSKWSKKIFEALPNEAGIDVDHLADRLTLAWLSDSTNNEAAKTVVENLKSCLEAD